MKYQEYVISDKGVKVDPIKIYIIKEWLTLRNILEVLFFLGFANFHRRFIKNYSKIAISLTNLFKKGVDWA